MPFEFMLPDLGEGIAEVELRRWLVKEGDMIAEHQPLLEVETDKAVVEVPAPRSGVVSAIRRREGDMVRVGEALLTIADRGDEKPQLTGSRGGGIVGVLPEAEDMTPPGRGEVVMATPQVRKLARERNIDLRDIRGSGPHGSITRDDLERSGVQSAASPEEFGPVERMPLRGLRRAIARNLMAAQRATAFVTGMEEADVTDLVILRSREQSEVEAHGTHMTYLPFFMKAVQHALREHPFLNASIDDRSETIILKKHYHFGISVDTPDGLMVPVIRDVDRKSIIELATEIQTLGAKARERTISRGELRGSSFTITNFGHFGTGFATPIINWPDAAILGCGRIADRPWIHHGEIVIRKILPLSLTF
ncbi:MAG TPA: dihydrolipoamide acetyltransferase family protein, partial [Geobacteraceae bacterium]|nr:dihydrolipoamide acetyltransferase family protein [Geobacteraceae bacterium]